MNALPLLLVDFETGGHHHLYLGHLARYAAANQLFEIRFLLPRELRDCVAAELSAEEARFFLPLVEVLEEDSAWQRAKRIVKSEKLALMLYVELLNLREKDRSTLFYLHLESLIYQAAWSPIPRFNSAGLMFRTTFYYRRRRMLDSGLRAKAVYFLKYLTAFALEKRPGFEKIFLLDPLAEEYARSEWKSKKYQWIPDPIGPAESDAHPVGSSLPTARRPITLLIAGALHPRKGISITVEALALTSEATRRDLCVCMVGKPMRGFEQYVADNIARLREMGIRTEADLRFVTDQEMDRAMAACDVILVPYRGFKGSSGLLIRAAHFGKPVIATDEGLLGYLVSKNGLGETVPVTDARPLAQCFERLADTGRVQNFDPHSARTFADTFDPEEFSALLLGHARAMATV